MVATPIRTDIPKPVGEQRVAFHNLSWDDYLKIFQALPQDRHFRLSFCNGTLEITAPLEDHEFALRLIELFIRLLVLEMGLKMKTMGSTTINRKDVKKGAEPDCAYYIQNQPQVAGRNVDFDKDPPPDLIIEVDITNTNINKNQLYAAMGVPEFWRYNGETLRIFTLNNGEYEECETSPLFSIVQKEDLYRFLAEAVEDEMEAMRNFQAFLKQKITDEDN
ncbi:Uma2 family endonuclease [Synechococcus sp. BDU 130192]|uniref:Uma2 family endonuclease n=1 Tax=Synechococcus sp. BDU 130192 TaxID=2042059 RepID=UPI000C08CB99|nr:Uma2 family endonuclease [Synechococcus sp. BDU 130192]